MRCKVGGSALDEPELNYTSDTYRCIFIDQSVGRLLRQRAEHTRKTRAQNTHKT